DRRLAATHPSGHSCRADGAPVFYRTTGTMVESHFALSCDGEWCAQFCVSTLCGPGERCPVPRARLVELACRLFGCRTGTPGNDESIYRTLRPGRVSTWHNLSLLWPGRSNAFCRRWDAWRRHGGTLLLYPDAGARQGRGGGARNISGSLRCASFRPYGEGCRPGNICPIARWYDRGDLDGWRQSCLRLLAAARGDSRNFCFPRGGTLAAHRRSWLHT